MYLKLNEKLLLPVYFLNIHLDSMFSDNDDAKAVAAEALWILAFSEENRKAILADEEIMSSLRALNSRETAQSHGYAGLSKQFA